MDNLINAEQMKIIYGEKTYPPKEMRSIEDLEKPIYLEFIFESIP